MWTPFDPAAVGHVFTTESRQKDEQMFTLTHARMNRILVSHNRVGLCNGQFVGEHEVLELIQGSAPLDSNRVWFVVGETGSGKSELCQWLEYQLRDRHVPIHISRRHANLTGILDVLHQHLPPGTAGQSTTLPQEVLADHLRLHLKVRAHREGRGLGYLEQLAPFFPELARRLYQPSAAPLELPADLPPPPPDLPLTAWLSGAAREVLGVHSLEPTLRALVEHYAQQGRRPVLLLEDITTLGFLRDDLLDFVFDLSAPGFDAVIGLTSGFEQSHLQGGGNLSEMAYVRDRLSARFQLSHASGETFFLNQPQDLQDLVRRYLGCLPQPAGGQAAAFAGLYPFTPPMLERLYLHLVESGNPRQTPRNLLDAVIKPALSLPAPPHVTLFGPHPYLRAPSLTFYHQDLPEEVQALLYWHGEVQGGSVSVPDEVAEAFGLPPVPPVQAFPTPTGATWLFGAREAEDPTDTWRDALRELQRWQNQGEPFPKRQHLKRGIERLVRTLLDPRAVQHPHVNALSADPLEYSRGGDHLPIYLPDSGDLLPEHWPSLHVPRTLPAQFLEECLTFSFSAGQHVECFADLGHTRQLLEEAVAAFQGEVRRHLERLVGMPYETLVFGVWWLCQHVCQGQVLSPRDPAGRGALLQYDLPPREIQVAWRAERPHRLLHRTHRELRDGRDAYRALFLSVFHHRDDLLDPDLFERECARFDPTLFLRALAGLSLPQVLRAPFRQRGSKLTLAQLLKPAVEYAAALQAYAPVEEDLARWARLEWTLDHALTHADALDTVCRDLERLAHQAGWTVSPPSSSHTWRAPEWRTLLTHSQGARSGLGQAPPLTQVTVGRTWRERLEDLEPVVWMKEVRAFHDTVQKILHERHPGARGAPATGPGPEGLIDLAALQELASRLEAAGQATAGLPAGVSRQVLRAVRRVRRRHHGAIQGVLDRHGIADPAAIADQSRDEGVLLLGDLLECTAELLTAGEAP
ncbi:hypothetical protein QOL99_09590 [Deinococcus sp. MIMF12]|uniref:ATP-binding protein n=1 Tax=Deinococcus rhizophilus TaxID=3049544 RepID=A0ABT7JH69_9DEIO|nr:hypothetical protein [Deinococcus rhizophilus]MDL2344406.1 hypothetical protein [Deinococcus rhizophilus]